MIKKIAITKYHIGDAKNRFDSFFKIANIRVFKI